MTLLQQQQRVQMAIVKVLEGQLGAGAASVFEVTQARIATDTTGLTLRDAERQVVETRSLLASSLGLPGAALDGVNFSFAVFTNSPAASPSVDARRQALLNRPDLLGALAEYAASDSALRLQIAKQYPDVHLNPGYEFDQGDNKWLLGLTISLPVLNQNRGAIAEAEARRSETAALFAGLQARIIGELDRAVAGYGASLDKVEMAEALRMKLYRQEKTTQVLIEAGELSRLALFTSQLELSSNALVRLGALAQVQQALGQLEDVLQSPVGLSESLWLASPQRGTAAKDIKHE